MNGLTHQSWKLLLIIIGIGLPLILFAKWWQGKRSIAKVSESLKPEWSKRLEEPLPGVWLYWKARLAALVGYLILLTILYFSFPGFWKSWYGTKELFWFTQALVVLLVITPIWGAGHSFAQSVICLAIICLTIGTLKKMYSNRQAGGTEVAQAQTTPVAHTIRATEVAQTPTGETETASVENAPEATEVAQTATIPTPPVAVVPRTVPGTTYPLGVAFRIAAPVNGWSELVLTPGGYRCEFKEVTRDSRLYFMMDNSPEKVYLITSKAGRLSKVQHVSKNGDKVRLIDSGPDHTSVGTSLRFQSGQTHAIEVELLFTPR